MHGQPAFSAEQLAVIDLPVDARTLVYAAAGTGKTHTVIGRVAALIERENLAAGDDLLILSFSRAAVSELRRRAAMVTSDARFVGTSTFDSFATRLLANVDPDGSWVGQSYDERVEAAARHLGDGTHWDVLELLRHVVVDEAQDLVGARVVLVRALLSRLACGFTVLGDPAQAIYGFRQDGGRKETSSDLHRWLIETYRADLVRRSLTRDYRALSPEADAVASIGAALREDLPDQGAIASSIRTVFLGLPLARPSTARRLFAQKTTTHAVLTRTNGQALAVSGDLHEVGIIHRLQRPGEDKAAAAWLSEALNGFDALRISRSAFEERLVHIAEREGLSVEACYRIVRLLDPAPGKEVDLRCVAQRVQVGDIPEELNTVAAANVVVSTVHRAKGLEFDRVMICDLSGSDACLDLGLENRVSYVALSRARSEIWHLDTKVPAGLRRDAATRRWVRRGFGPNRWKTFDLEVRGADVDGLHPAGSWLVQNDVADTQTYIYTRVVPGDPVTLDVLSTVGLPELAAHYAILHNGRPVGVTSDRFGETLARALGTRTSARTPARIDGLHVEVVDTVAGIESLGRRTGLGAHGLWARVRIAGLGAFSWADHEGGK